MQRHFKLPSGWLVQPPSAASPTPSAASTGQVLRLPAGAIPKDDAAAANEKQGRLGLQTWLYLIQVSCSTWMLHGCADQCAPIWQLHSLKDLQIQILEHQETCTARHRRTAALVRLCLGRRVFVAELLI
jgi:hypothetical protein